jgi:protoporphyrinogen oxidase
VKTFIIGGGVTGLAAGIASGLPILEAAETPGGICATYYLRPGSTKRLSRTPDDGEAFRFERGGGHWIFGASETVRQLLESMQPLKTYQRKASVFFPDRNQHVPYPIQSHRCRPSPTHNEHAATLRDWLLASFGPALCEEFFFPFNERYTAGLYDRIAPQDGYKSPRTGSGYNVQFVYPVNGLDALLASMAQRCQIDFASQVTAIDPAARIIETADGRQFAYDRLISTLPLNRMMVLTGLAVDAPPDPWTSVEVLNLAALRGAACPDAHWCYIPRTEAGFCRVGFYDNVDPGFLPCSMRTTREVVSLYVERAFIGGQRPTAEESQAYSQQVIRELQDWKFIGEPLLADTTWIDIAYTWSWPGSLWCEEALTALEAVGIRQVGRYARWKFQGIADSIQAGLVAGAPGQGATGR